MWLHNKPKLWHLSDTWKVSFFVLDSPVNKVRKVARRQKNYTGAALWCSLQFVLCHPHRVGPAHGWFSMFLMLNGPKKQEKKGGVHYLSVSQYTAHTRPWTTSFHYVPWWAETSGRRDHNVWDYSVDALVHTGKHQWSPAEYAAFAVQSCKIGNEHPECHLQFVLVFGMSVFEPDLLQVEDSSRDPLDSVHHPLRIWRPLASHCNVLVQV